MASGRSEEENLPIEDTAGNTPTQKEESTPDKKEEPSNAPQPTPAPEPEDDKKKDSKNYEEDMLAMIEHFQNMQVDPLGDALADKLNDAVKDFFKWYRSKQQEEAPEAERPEGEIVPEAQETPDEVSDSDEPDLEVSDSDEPDLEEPEVADFETPDIGSQDLGSQEGTDPTLVSGGTPESIAAHAAMSSAPRPAPLGDPSDSLTEAQEENKTTLTAKEPEEQKQDLVLDTAVKAAVMSQGGDAATAEQVSGMIKRK